SNRRCPTLANTHPTRGESYHRRLLVGLRPSRYWRHGRVSRLRPNGRGTHDLGPTPSRHSRLRTDSAPSILRPVLPHPWNVDGKWNSPAQGSGSGHGDRVEQIFGVEISGGPKGSDRRRESLQRAREGAAIPGT